MDNRLAPANVDASDLPSGFSIADPNGAGGSVEQEGQAQQRQAQKDAILQQALTPDALERLRRIKVRNPETRFPLLSHSKLNLQPLLIVSILAR